MASYPQNSNADSNEYCSDTTVSTSTDGRILMEATSSTPSFHRHVSSLENLSTDADYQQPSSSSNLCNSPPKSQLSTDGHTVDSESNTSIVSNSKKIGAHFCEFFDHSKGQCKQRAINTFKYCIRHILLDPTAPYKQCQHQRKPKNKSDKPVLCTNAIRTSCPEIYCSTHLIMNGLRDPKVSKKDNKTSSKIPEKEKADKNEKSNGSSENYPHISAVLASQISNKFSPHTNTLHRSEFDRISAYSTSIGDTLPPERVADFNQSSPMPANALMLTPNNNGVNFQMNQLRDSRSFAEPANFRYYENNQQNFRIDQRGQQLLSEEKMVFKAKSSQNDEMLPCSLSKTHPQLAAKLLQPKVLGVTEEASTSAVQQNEKILKENHILLPPQPNVQMSECFSVGDHRPPHPVSASYQQPNTLQSPSFNAHNQPSTGQNSVKFPAAFAHEQPSKMHLADNLLNAKCAPKNTILKQEFITDSSVVQRIPRVIPNQKEIVQPSFTYLPSSLTFLNSNPPPRRYDLNRLERKYELLANGDNDSIEFQRERHAPIENGRNVTAADKKRQPKVIKLRQKRQKVHIEGAFRSIPMVDTMCRIVESQDFDRKDLFPLGLEPSDDESSDDSFPSLGEEKLDWPSSSARPCGSRLELYLLKKQLRLESSRLVQRAKLCVPINTAAREYKNSVGAALRVRRNNKKKENSVGEHQRRLLRCSFTSKQPQKSMDGLLNAEMMVFHCSNVSLPWARHCADHITYNVPQQLYSFCKWHLCNETLPITDLVLFDGFCRHHHGAQQRQKAVVKTELIQQQQVVAPNNMLTMRTLSNPLHHPKEYSLRKNAHLEQFHHQQQHHPPHLLSRPSNIRCDPFEGSSVHFAVGTNATMNRGEDHLNDTMDVSLASVAKDLGFDGHDLTDMLAKLPVEEGFEGDMDPDEDNLLTDINKEDSDDAPPGVMLGHSWADVEQFLLEQEEGTHHPSHISTFDTHLK